MLIILGGSVGRSSENGEESFAFFIFLGHGWRGGGRCSSMGLEYAMPKFHVELSMLAGGHAHPSS